MQFIILPLGVTVIAAFVLGAYLMNQYKAKQICNMRNRLNQFLDNFHLLNHWLEIKNEGKRVSSYFEDMGYKHIAIYGMADLANRLSEELAGSSVSIDYGIDRDVCCSIARIGDVYFPEDELPKTDVIVVTPYSSFESIKAVLEKKVECPIISIEDVIWSM